ncbi:MAG: glycosyltransferase [Gemmataceae bacterium]
MLAVDVFDQTYASLESAPEWNHASAAKNTAIPAVVVSASAYLDTQRVPGGVQICTQEYLATLRAAGFAVTTLDYEPDRRLRARLRRVLQPRPYANRLPPDLEDRIVNAVNEKTAYVFLNQVDLAPLAENLKKRLGGRAKLVLLSHGLESVDHLHFLRARGLAGPFQKARPADLMNLARRLVAECNHRLHLDHVLCLSSFEAEIERWLGARQVQWLPRTISGTPLDWRPKGTFIGYVGTLDHAPNTEGLVLFLRALEGVRPPCLRVRVIGSPRKAAEQIANRYPFVDYLGPLTDSELREEAAGWNGFVHPLFCYARGCSTKLAVALGWQIPVLTTSPGCRGYIWQEGRLALGETPEELAALAVRMLDDETAQKAFHDVQRVVQTSPTLDEVAARVRNALLTADPKEALCESS